MIVLNEHHGYPDSKPLNTDLSAYSDILNGLKFSRYFIQERSDQLCFSLEYDESNVNKYLFKSSYFIGVDWLVENKLPIYVQPKINDENNSVDYLTMLFESLKENENYNHLDYLYNIDFKKPLIKIRQKQDLLSPLLIIQYLNVLKKIVRKGLKKSYYKKTTNFSSKVKGKILINKTIRHNHFKGDHFSTYCSYNEFGYNSIENKVLKKALEFSERVLKNLKGSDNINLQSILSFIKPAFDKVDNKVEIHDLKNYKSNPLFKEYEQALYIAKLILKRYGYNIKNVGENLIQTPPFWIDMSMLFELYVYKKLRNLFPIKGEVIYHKKFHYLEPDFIINSKDGNYKIIVDAKYKPRYAVKNISVDDIRQVSGYARLSSIYQEMKLNNLNKIIDCLIVYSDQENEMEFKNRESLKANKIPHYIQIYKTGLKLPYVD
ncbi:McrC family protein [Aestuariibaculum lutulentum]|uniref:McrC family protein n=1 Tax=Aestuariibaculum lutulentum TaxID=2920935 RepID=A0ABS9RHH1_9FLAO|nr:McrC family protein [Aestuariibaculum lutulentum]MCH4551981.1 McrC family protein [Aestuariibaculum lutulentum]